MVDVRQVEMGGNLKEFLDVVETIYAGDANYIRPLDQDLKDRLNPKKNPFFEHADGVLFTAHKGNRCVGRISASIDREHLDRHKDETGFWGFLDTVDDPEVAKALLGRAEAWLRDKGMKRSQGPMSLSINEEIGCLIEGFDTPPVLMMPHHRPYQSGLIEKAGYEKLKDVFAWKYTVGQLNPRTKKAHEEIKAMPEVTSRPVSLKDVERDTNIVLDVFNDAWSDNWGFVPLTRAEMRKTAADFKLILAPEITRIAFIDGEPAAVAVTLPNVNDMIKDLNGKLFPLGLPKLLYRLKVEGPRSARLIILGIRKKYRHVRKYAGLSLYLFGELNEGGKKIGIQWGELGWTLEENAPVNTAIKLMGAKLYKKYRIYARPLTAGGAT
jgi:hypothetical protein